MAVTPALRSPGTYIGGSAGSAPETLNSTIPAGEKAIFHINWYGTETVTGVADNGAGGSQTWTIHDQSDTGGGGNGPRCAIASADCAAGLASGTVVTATFSAASAQSIATIVESIEGLATNASGGVDDFGHTNDTNTTVASPWLADTTVTVVTTDTNTVLVAHCMMLGGAGSGTTPTSPAVELHEWTTFDGDKMQMVYTELTSSGAQTIGGAFDTSNREYAAVCVAWKLFVDPSVNGHILLEDGTGFVLAENGDTLVSEDFVPTGSLMPMIVLLPRR